MIVSSNKIVIILDYTTKISDFIRDVDTIDFFHAQCGGGCYPGVPFANVTDDSGPQEFKFSRSAPRWRAAKPGLCLEGKCTNKYCDAYGRMVIMNKGRADFDLINDAHTCRCPMCSGHVVSDTCAFNNCEYRFVGRKMDNLTKRPEMFRTEWKSAGNVYTHFSPEQNSMANFLDLKILVDSRRPSPRCAVCAETSISGEMKAAQCGHQFHEKCLDLATGKDCIECVARQSMTRHQKLFA